MWATKLLFETLDRQLQHDSGMPHTYYVILAMLSEAPQRTLTMGQLADIVRSSPSRLSHAVARLEEAGWVRRSRPSTDRRTTHAQLTEQGYEVLVAVERLSGCVVRRAVAGDPKNASTARGDHWREGAVLLPGAWIVLLVHRIPTARTGKKPG